MNVHRTTVKTVKKQLITPNFLRVILKCEDIEPFKDVPLGVNNKMYIKSDNNEIITRTYTHRYIDLNKKELTVDFAIHEGESVACSWAKESKAGDEIGLAMKLQHREVLKEANEYLFITDMTGIPVVAALVQRLSKDVKATIVTEIVSKADEYPDHYKSEADLTLKWFLNETPESGSDLFEFAKADIDELDDSHFVHITTEFSTVKAFRDYLKNDKGWHPKDFFACAYWQVGKKEHEERQKRMD